MARKRDLKPGLFRCGELWDAGGPALVLFFEALWTIADREGRLCDRPTTIRADACPLLELDPDAALWTLHRAGFVIRYSVGGLRYLQIVNFSKHQEVCPDEKASQIPPLEGFEPGKCIRKGSNAFYSPSTLNGTPIDALLDTLSNTPIKEGIKDPIDGVVNYPSGTSLSPCLPVSLENVVENSEVVGGVGESSESKPLAADAATTPASKSKSRKEATDPKGTRIPPDWKPGSEGWKWARDRWKDVPPDVLKEAYRRRTENFVTYWTNLPGAKARKLNWYQTWQNSLKDDEAEGRFFRRDSVVTSVSSSAQNRLPTPAEVIAAEAERNRLFRERNGLPQVEAGQ